LSIEQGGNGVLIRCSDGYEADGDILVGADGAYSAVRQGLYERLKRTARLPPTDALPLPFSTVCLVGQTRPLTAEEFPDIAKEKCQFRRTIGKKKMYSVSVVVFVFVRDSRYDDRKKLVFFLLLTVPLIVLTTYPSSHLVGYFHYCPKYRSIQHHPVSHD
jgi:2-polyprenyl-6-methoxyphenol hydroxylase-like FAD-dependent oxidoreductase